MCQSLLTTTTNLQTLSAAADTTNYTYNPAGNLTSASDAQNTGGTQTQCYTYDNLGQLTTAWTDTGGQTTAAAPSVPGVGGCTHTTPAIANVGGPAEYWESYSYDLLGDRTSETSYNTAGITADNITQTLTYPGAGTAAAAQPSAAGKIVTQYGTTGSSDTTTPVYNADGETTKQTLATSGTSPPPAPPAESAITYNPQGQTASVTTPSGTSSYIYGASGNLIVQADPGKVTYYADGGAEEIIYNTSVSPATATALRFYSAPDETEIIRSSSGTISYETANQQSTALESVNASTLAITRRYYDPYGNPAGTAPPSWPDANGFVGKPADPATSLDLLGARQYDPATGAFLSLDPEFEAGNPLQMGGYAYAADDPVSGSDPTGLQECEDGHCYTTTPPPPDPPSPTPVAPTPPGNNNPVKTIIDQEPHARQLQAAYTAQLGTLGHAFGAHIPQYLEWLALAQACSLNPGLCGSDLQNLAYSSAAQGQAAYQAQTSAFEQATDKGGAQSLLFTASLAITFTNPELAPEEATMIGIDDAIATLDGSGLDGLDPDLNPGCGESFTAGTKVLLASGAAIPISKAEVGDKVLATNVTTGKTRPETVTAVMIKRDTDRYDLKIKTSGDTAVIETTHNHLFWDVTQDKWVKAGRLQQGDNLRTSDGEPATVVAGSAPAVLTGWMWDLSVPGGEDHDFYIELATNAVLVHNCAVRGGDNPAENPDMSSLNKVSDSRLKQQVGNVHAFKEEILGKGTRIALFNTYVDKSTGYLFLMARNGDPIPTYFNIGRG